MIVYIYALFDPISEELKYIGKANNIKTRLKEHMNDLRGVGKEKTEWILKLKERKLKPIVEVLDEVSHIEWQYWEDFWMSYFKSYGLTLISKRSGNGPSFSNKQSYKVGNKPWNLGMKKIDGKYVKL